MTHEDYVKQAIALGAVTMRVFRVKKYVFNVGTLWEPFSYHFFDIRDEEICYYIHDLINYVSMFVFYEHGMPNREWSNEFKDNPAYEFVELNTVKCQIN